METRQMGHSSLSKEGRQAAQIGCSLLHRLKGGCSHERANLYFEESIHAVNPEVEGGNRFLGRLCGSWEDFQAGLCCDNPTAVMGEWMEPR